MNALTYVYLSSYGLYHDHGTWFADPLTVLSFIPYNLRLQVQIHENTRQSTTWKVIIMRNFRFLCSLKKLCWMALDCCCVTVIKELCYFFVEYKLLYVFL